MAEYRVYVLDKDGHISRAIELVCPDDEAAKQSARQFVDGHDIELWQRGRQIAKFDRVVRPTSYHLGGWSQV